MSESGTIHPDPAQWRGLRLAATANLAAGALVLVGGFLSGSQAVTADALDFLGLGSIAAVALLALGRDQTSRARAVLIQAVVQGLLSFLVIIAAIYRLFGERTPQPAMMAAFGLCALAANAVIAHLVLKDSGVSAGARAIWTRSRSDLLEDGAIVAAALTVWLSGSAWADCLVAAVIAAPLLRSSWTTMLDSRGDLSGADRRRRRAV
ncbi:MAG: cation transporter [Rhizomicrobium sp.]